MNNSVKVDYDFNKDDYFKFLVFCFWESPENKSKRVTEKIIVFFVVFGIFSLLLFLLRSDASTFPPIILVSVIIYIAYLIGLDTRKSHRLHKYGLKCLNNPINRNYNLSVHFEFYDEFFIARNSVCESKMYWGSITKAIETDDYFYIFINETNAYILPKRVFIPSEDLKKIREFLLKKCELLNYNLH